MKTRENNIFMGKPIKKINAVIKPIETACNLECDYCFYARKKDLVPPYENFCIMSDETLETLIRNYIQEQNSEKITFFWHCNDPIVLGVSFFKKAVELQKKYLPKYKTCENLLQMNGTLFDDGLCKFLKENDFRIEIDIDGPKELHDKYRKDNKGLDTFDRVMKTIKSLKECKIQFNSKTYVNRDTIRKPLEVYRFLRDEVGADMIKLIPVVELKNPKKISPLYWKEEDLIYEDSKKADPDNQDSILNHWSVKPEEYGDFLISIFDEWYQKDLGKVFIPMFESAIRQWMGGESHICSFSSICGKTLSVGYSGDVHCCDHCTFPEYKLGNIKDSNFGEMILSDKQQKFGYNKREALPSYCKNCKWSKICNGGCLKNRFIKTKDGELGINYLCKGFKKYFEHINPYITKIIEKTGWKS